MFFLTAIWAGLVPAARAQPSVPPAAATRPIAGPATRAADPDLVGWWRAGHASGDGLVDLSGKGHAARSTGGKPTVETVDGRAGTRLTGADRGLSAGTNGAFDVTADFTAALWVKLATNTGDATLLSKMDPDGDGGWAIVHGIRRVGGVGFVAAPRVFVPTPLKATDAWVHVAVTFRHKEFLLYVDGKQIGIRELEVVPPPAKAPLTLGASADGRSGMDGWLDDVRIYHRALSDAEVESLAAGREPASPYVKLSADEEKRTRALIMNLGADAYAWREEAAAALKAMGRKAYPLLRQYRDSDDIEVASRVKALLGELPSSRGGEGEGRK
jgi:hypothetical protein